MKRELTFLHTNDIHSSFTQELKLASLLRQKRADLRAQGRPVLVVDGGDHLDMAVMECLFTNGQLNLDLHDALGYDAAAVGNNEGLRFSLERIREMSHATRVPWLLANVRESDGSLIGGMRDALLLDASGIQVGLIGITDQFGTIYEDLMPLKNVDTITTVQSLAENLRSRGADLIVVLSHAGLPQDIELAQSVTGDIDLIIGGHSHDALHEPQHHAGIWVVQTGSHARFLGELHLELDLTQPTGQKITRATGTLHPIEEDMTPDEELNAIYQAAQTQVQQKMSEVLCVLDNPLEHVELVQRIAKAMRTFYQAELGMMFGAVAIEGFPAGPIQVGDIYRNLMSLVNVAHFEFQGKQLLGLLHERNNPDYYAHPKYGNGIRPKGLPIGKLQFDGLTWTELDGTISNVQVNGEPLDLDRWYTVGGGEHLGYVETLLYPSLAGAKILHVDDYYYVKDAFVEYLRHQKNTSLEVQT
ncbi:bifunctional metallophosphatase/5'-nucleotidase [Tumebacillus sp. ITR2]|uniref:Bifunctional metallophosphatase/5'-nucleotidase n=1 Tax=Tumebacillus amylolyticus TaxID=2801339 RepID=A0ABS1J4J7_9BACL|nr:bifunctional UDP-sugar hydrolase/5'-nucleotidase [Tumebacillus amylolyticus]MBL0385193.1 bifunctional metallophosphatase/5'-nucleotidase [Tumebacillus amylolyticus]